MPKRQLSLLAARARPLSHAPCLCRPERSQRADSAVRPPRATQDHTDHPTPLCI